MKSTFVVSRRLRTLAACVVGLFGIASILATGGPSRSTDGAPTWSKSFGGELSDNVASAIPTADGGYLFVGNRDAVAGPGTSAVANVGPLWVTKLDARGDIQWEHRLSDATLLAEDGLSSRTFSHVVAAADGGVWLIGDEVGVAGAYKRDLVVTRLDSGGEILWTRTYDGDWATPDAHFYPDGETAELPGAATETPEAGLWIAAKASAFVRDTSVVDEGTNVGVDLTSMYLLKLAANGDVLVSRHSNIQGRSDANRMPRGGTPQAIHTLADGGVAVLVPELTHDFVLISDAAGALLSKTAIARSDTFVGSGAAQPRILDIAPTRRDDDRGFFAVGSQADANGPGNESLVARYLPTPRDADDPTEGHHRHEVSPRENHWRIEIPDATEIWGVVTYCDPVATPCNAIVAGKGRTVNTMVLTRIDANGDVRRSREVAGIEHVCAIQQEPVLTGASETGYRLLVRDASGRSGTHVLDASTLELDAFVPGAGGSCGPGSSASFATDGEWAALRHVDNALDVYRTTLGGAARWRHSFATASERWQRALVARQTDDDGDGASDDGYLVGGESGNSSGRPQAFVVKLGRLGETTWQRALPGLSFTSAGRPLTGAEFAAVQSNAYGLVVRDSTGATRALTLDPSGSIIWQQSLWQQYFDASIVPLRDGGWLVGAGSGGGGVLARLASAGETQWTRTLGNLQAVDSLFETAAGELVVGGRRGLDPVVAKFDASGLPMWSRRLIGIDNQIGEDDFNGADVHVAPASDDGVFVATTVRGAPTGASLLEGESRGFEQDLLLQQFDADGTRRGGLERRYGGRYDDVLTSLRATSDGGAILGARSNSLGDRNDRTEAWLLRVGPDGRISSLCAAELAGSRFAGIGVGASTVTSVEADRLALGAVDGLPFPVPTDFSLFTSSTASTVARQCSGIVGPAPGTSLPPVQRLRVIQGGAITGVVSSIPAGISCGTGGGGTCEADFDKDLLVTLDVDPGSRSTFESWSGCDSATATRCLVRMGTDRIVTATFATEPRSPNVSLVLSSITGRGRVTGTGGINCRSGSGREVCAVSLLRGSTALLRAIPDTGRSFLGWGGHCHIFGNERLPPPFTMEVVGPGTTIDCTAQFSGPPFGAPEISVDVRPTFAGNVTSEPAGIDCGATNALCTEGFVSGTDVTLTASPTRPGWEFLDFLCQGQVRNPARSITLPALTSNTQCQANFADTIERLFVRIVRDANGALANGRVYVEGGGLDCNRDCDRPFLRNQSLIVRADPLPQYVLSAWSGCSRVVPDSTTAGALSHCEVRMDQRREVVAFFSQLGPGPNTLHSLVVNFANGSARGLVTSNPGAIDCTPTDGLCVATFNVGTSVTLTVVPAAGGNVASHTGCDTFTPASGAAPALCSVTLGADRVVTFGFAPANSAPVAAFTVEPVSPTVGQAVNFDAAGSSDDNSIASYAWDFQNDGSVDAATRVAVHAYAPAGTYTARLVVTDADGLSDDQLRTIVVTPAPQPLMELEVSVQGGHGRVVSTPPGIDCVQGQQCIANFTRDQIVTLGVTPDIGQKFDGWGGDPDCAANVAPNATATVNLALVSAPGPTVRVVCRANFYTASIASGWTRNGISVNVTPNTTPAQVGTPAIALGANGRPVVAFMENGLVVVRRWDGPGAWQTIGAPLGNGTANTVSLTIDVTGAPVVAWDHATATVSDGTSNVSVARWNATADAWVSLGGVFVGAISPSIRARSADVALAWAEGSFIDSRVVVRTWNGTAWVNAGVSDGPPPRPGILDQITAPRLAVGGADELAVAWLQNGVTVRVAELQGGIWVPTATDPLPPATRAIQQIDIAHTAAEGLLVVAQPGNVAGPITVRRWRAGGWTDLGTPRGNFGAAPARMFGVAFSHNRTGATPLLAYSRRDGSNSVHEFVVERFNGADWAVVSNPVPARDRHNVPRNGGGSTVGVVDSWQPFVITRVTGVLLDASQLDESIVVWRSL